MAVRVVVGEDQLLVREGIVRVLEQAGFEVVGVAADAQDLLRKTNAHKPDVVITDIQMPPDRTDDGLRAAIEIRRSRPETGVVVLSQFLEDRYALELVGERADGVGYLLKDRVGDPKLFVRLGAPGRGRRLGARPAGHPAHGRSPRATPVRSTSSRRASARSWR